MYGPFGNMFPYSNQHTLNLDWIIQVAKDFLDQYTSIQETITAGTDSIDQHTQEGITALGVEKERLEGLLDAWYTTHSEDIAGELTTAIAGFRTAAEAIGAEVIADIPEDYTALSDKVESVTSSTLNLWLWGNQTVTGQKTVTDEANLPAGTYTLSAVVTRDSSSNVRMVFYKDSPTSENMLANPYIASGSRDSVTFTLAEKANIIRVYSGASASSTYEATWSDIQLQTGSSASAYIPPVTGDDFSARLDITSLKARMSAAENTITNNLIKSKMFYGLEEMSFSDTSENGITFDWINGWRCHIYGTASANAYDYVYNNTSKLPDSMAPGDIIGVLFNSTNAHIAFRIKFTLSNSGTSDSPYLTSPGFITVPANAVGMQAYIFVLSGYTVDGYASVPLLFKSNEQNVLMAYKAKKPVMVSFIDDDTSSTAYVTKYHENCLHNGITGSYAVITSHVLDEDTDIDKLLDYEYDGFNMIVHCQEQKPYMTPFSESFDMVKTRENIFTAINEFNQLGLRNPGNMWIIPYGVSREDIQDLAKDCGFDMAFTTLSDAPNFLTEQNKYKMKRTTLHPYDKITDDTDPTEAGTVARCKARIDELIASPAGGWQIFTTHFNEWDNESWDSTLDSNGYETGYSRFNEIVQYAIAQGCEIVSMAKGASVMKPCMDKNFSNG